MSPRLLDLGAPLDSCPSTQEICRELAARGAPEGTCALALAQSAGRGRNGRPWDSPARLGLYISFLLRPRVAQALWPGLTPLVALALAEVLDQHPARPSGWRARIKWPNDVYGDHGKLAGILAEVVGSPAPAVLPGGPTSEPRTTEGAKEIGRMATVIGLGLNLGQSVRDFPEELRGRASSLRIEGFSPVPDAADIARRLDERLSELYDRFHGADRSFLRDRLLERFLLRGARVRVGAGGRVVQGVAVDLGPLGELVIETPEGTASLSAGEVLSFEPGPGRSRGRGTI